MLSKSEKLRLKTLITDTVVLLCKNGLVPKVKGQFSIEGLIGISLEEDDLMLVSFHEKLHGLPSEQESEASETGSDQDLQITASARKKRHKRLHKKDYCYGDEPSPKRNITSVNNSTSIVDNTLPLPSIPDFHTSPTVLYQSMSSTITPQHQPVKFEHPDNKVKTQNPLIGTVTPLMINPETDIPLSNVGTLTVNPIQIDDLGFDGEAGVKRLNQSGGDGNVFVNNSDTNSDSVNSSKVSVKLEKCEADSDDDLVMVKHEQAPANLPLVPSMVTSSGYRHSLPEISTPINHMLSNLQAPPTAPDAMLPKSSSTSTEPQSEVELLPGSGVFIKSVMYEQLLHIDKGTKLVRKLVREVFPDVQMLANSSCNKAKGSSDGQTYLDPHKINVIKDFTFCRFRNVSEFEFYDTVGQVCRECRRHLKRQQISLQKRLLKSTYLTLPYSETKAMETG